MSRGDGIPLNEAVPMLAEALAYYDETDVRRWFDRYERMTGHEPRVYPATIKDCRTFVKVPNEPFRKAYLALNQPMVLGVPAEYGPGAEESNVTGSEMEWAGIFREELTRVEAGPRNTDARRLRDYLSDALGIRPRKGSSGGIGLTWLIQYEVGEALCKTLGLRPVDVGV